MVTCRSLRGVCHEGSEQRKDTDHFYAKAWLEAMEGSRAIFSGAGRSVTARFDETGP